MASGGDSTLKFEDLWEHRDSVHTSRTHFSRGQSSHPGERRGGRILDHSQHGSAEKDVGYRAAYLPAAGKQSWRGRGSKDRGSYRGKGGHENDFGRGNTGTTSSSNTRPDFDPNFRGFGRGNTRTTSSSNTRGPDFDPHFPGHESFPRTEHRGRGERNNARGSREGAGYPDSDVTRSEKGSRIHDRGSRGDFIPQKTSLSLAHPPNNEPKRGQGRGRGSHRGGGQSNFTPSHTSLPTEDTLDRRKTKNSQENSRDPHTKALDKDKSWFDNVKNISVGDIMKFSRSSPEDLVNDLHNKLKSFQATLVYKRTFEKPGIMDAILNILSKIAKTMTFSNDNCRKASQILGEVLSERCVLFQFHLKMYIKQELPKSEVLSYRSATGPNMCKRIRVVCELFRDLLQHLPGSSWSCLPVEELKDTVARVLSNDDSTISLREQSLGQLMETVMSHYDSARESYSRRIKQDKSEDVDVDWDNSEYRNIRILPQWDEVCTEARPPRLRKNIVSGAYTDWLHYYDIQFRLLREDFVAPLRNGICDFINGARGRKLKNVRVYTNILIQEPVFRESGICYKIKLDFSHMRRHCNWEHSKRLLHGSLLCLSPDNDKFTKEVYFATVTDRDAQKLSNGDLEIMFQADQNILSFSCTGVTFTMVESCAYFEASRHILHSLQTAEVDTMPFDRYLLSGDFKSVDQPLYLAALNPFLTYNLSFLLTEEEKLPQSSASLDSQSDTSNDNISSESDDYDSGPDLAFLAAKLPQNSFLVPQVTNFNHWPTCDQTELDDSQLKGIKMALTQEIAVIQGPPGTGKTYIGLKVVEALLSNKEVWNSSGSKSPILIMCYTNHALDQFLEGILDSLSYGDRTQEKLKLIRIGSRTKSERMEKYSLRNAQRDVFLVQDVREEKRQAEERVREFGSQSSENMYYQLLNTNRLLSLHEITEYHIISPEHYQHLFWYIRTVPQQKCALEIWLGLVGAEGMYWPMSPSTNQTDRTQSSAKPPQSENEEALSDNGHLQSDREGSDSEATSDDEDSLGDEDEDDSESEENNEAIEDKMDTETIETEEDANALIDIKGEATMEQSERILDGADHELVKEVKSVRHSANFNGIIGSLTSLCNEAAAIEIIGQDGQKYYVNDKSIIFNKDWALQNLHHLLSATPMQESEYMRISNIATLPLEDRWRLYWYWHSECLSCLREKCEAEFREYNRLCQERDQARKKADRFALETADIIGMTTTGAAKYQHILHLVKPRIVIVEEAAEVLESHIVSALNAGTQHLILIGDHKQLRPKPNEYELAKKYNLDISLFERLVRNGFPHATLEYQHRMRPEIAQLVKPHIYTTLSNHPVVEQYSDIMGVSTNLFFINHQFEEREDENLVSHSNPHEADYLVHLCKYLFQQRYTPKQITILVTYAGQMLAMRKKMPKEVFEGLRVSTVDNYQGEENDIILLSLVRSNSEKKVGFLKEDNRVCVALSRARKGFYCIGNFDMLRDQVPLWESIMSDMEEKGKLGDGLLLYCSNHHDTNFVAKVPRDFAERSPQGGCLRDCAYRLKCGHVCDQKCHYTDPDHNEYVCWKSCPKSCNEGHPCRGRCWEKCKCMVQVTRQIPDCGHDQEMHCYESPMTVKCENPCAKKCEKGHSCPLKCYKNCRRCKVEVSVSMPSCQHQQWIQCWQDPAHANCKANCSHICVNGHPCPKLCYEDCGACEIPVTKKIPVCSHEIKVPCHVDPSHDICTEPCAQILPCSHKCSLKCGAVCSSVDCTVKVTVKLPVCKHTVTIPCYVSIKSDLSDIFCQEKCQRSLDCGHGCDLKCGESCRDQCMIKVNKAWPCGHKLKRPCYQILTPEEYPCEKECEKTLQCGHSCSKKCGEPCDDKCKEEVTKTYPCGHDVKALCSSTPSESPCKFLCTYILACGHKCSGNCSDCTDRHFHNPCHFDIAIKRYCGHPITVPCCLLKDSHSGKKAEISITCSHETISKKCSDRDQHTCEEPCDWSCPHHSCTKLCYEICDRPICNERCELNLKCGHQCFGVCGDPCLPVCPKCQLKKFTKKLKLATFNAKCLYYELPCKHIFSVEDLEDHVKKAVSSYKDLPVMPLQCPLRECQHSFSCSYRYGNHMKRFLSNLEEVNDIIAQTSTSSHDHALQRRVRKYIESPKYTEDPYEDKGSSKKTKEFWKGWKIIRSDNCCVQYTPLPEVSETLYNMNKYKLNNAEDKYLKFMFTEALSLLETIIDFSKPVPDSNSTSKDVKGFLRLLSCNFNHQPFKLTYQVIIDLQNELLRLFLGVYILLAKYIHDIPAEALVKAESYFNGHSSQMSTKITRDDFRFHVKSLSELIRKIPCLDYERTLRDMDTFHPVIQKGKWWRCTSGHYYCSPPSILENIVLTCPECKGEEKFTYCWQQLNS